MPIDINSNLEANILEFFNQVIDPNEIVERIIDDPGFGRPSPGAYGIRPSLAREILAVRGALPGGRFDSLEQISTIRGVGKDTRHDIDYNFRRVQVVIEFWANAMDPAIRTINNPIKSIFRGSILYTLWHQP